MTVDALKAGASEEPELRDRFFQTIESETKRLSRLIHDLLDLGRLEAGVFELEKQTISLHGLINRAVNALEPRMRTLGIFIQLDVGNLMIQGDPERLLQAILNLLDNAIKHSPANSQVFISAYNQGPANSQVFISAYNQGKQVIIQIQDQGKGIKEGDIPRIFEQFYTTDPARKGSGNGLGLAISKRIIEAHQGSIIASNTPNQGATFTIYLPKIRNS